MPQAPAPAKPTSNTIDIPGIGSYELPAPYDPNAPDTADTPIYQRRGNARGPNPSGIMTPEVMAGLSAILAPETGGMSLAIPPLVGAGTSAVRDMLSADPSKHDAQGMTGRALTHGAVNAIPGIGGKLYEAGPSMLPSLASMATGGKAGLLRGLGRILFGAGPEVKAAATEAAPVAADLGQYATAAGQKQVVQAMVALENKMNAATGPAKLAMQKQMAVLEDLNRQILAKIQAPPTQAGAMAATGLPPIRTAADTMKGSIVGALRALLAGGGLLPQERP